jgi:large subunit ribosomal protein L9
MKVILLKNVENVGLAGDVAAVKNGYFRNFLSPRSMAIEASSGNLKMMEHRRKSLRAEAEKLVLEAREAGEKLREVTITFTMKAGANDRLFGSVSQVDIAERLVAEGYEVDKRQVVIPYPIKEVGKFSATVKIHTHVHVPVKVVVERERSEEEIAEEARALKAEQADADEAGGTGESPEAPAEARAEESAQEAAPGEPADA